ARAPRPRTRAASVARQVLWASGRVPKSRGVGARAETSAHGGNGRDTRVEACHAKQQPTGGIRAPSARRPRRVRGAAGDDHAPLADGLSAAAAARRRQAVDERSRRQGRSLRPILMRRARVAMRTIATAAIGLPQTVSIWDE